MMMLKRFSLFLLVGAILFGGLEFVVGPLSPGGLSFVSTAQAEVGRPLYTGKRCRGGAAHSAALTSEKVITGPPGFPSISAAASASDGLRKERATGPPRRFHFILHNSCPQPLSTPPRLPKKPDS